MHFATYESDHLRELLPGTNKLVHLLVEEERVEGEPPCSHVRLPSSLPPPFECKRTFECKRMEDSVTGFGDDVPIEEHIRIHDIIATSSDKISRNISGSFRGLPRARCRGTLSARLLFAGKVSDVGVRVSTGRKRRGCTRRRRRFHMTSGGPRAPRCGRRCSAPADLPVCFDSASRSP